MWVSNWHKVSIIIVQDDQLIKEKGWNTRMRKPFEAFDDVFAVTARTSTQPDPES